MSPSEHRTAVLLDEHPLWLEGVEQVLARIGIEVKGKATSPEHALALVEEHRPSLLVTGIEMGDGQIDGLECLALAKQRAPELKVIVLSAHSDPQYVDAALAAGAEAYVLKTAHADDLASAIRQAFDHSIYFARGTTARAGAPASRSRRPGASHAASWRSSRSWPRGTRTRSSRACSG